MYSGGDATVSILIYWNLFLIAVAMPIIRVATIKITPLSRTACSSINVPPVRADCPEKLQGIPTNAIIPFPSTTIYKNRCLLNTTFSNRLNNTSYCVANLNSLLSR